MTFAPLTVQIVGVVEEKLTASPEVAVPLNGSGVGEIVRSAGGVKEIVCAAFAMTIVNGWTASGAVPFDAVIDPLNEPAAVGVPEMSPAVASIVSPGGRPTC
ncbi:MAG TPA: hypothetical protein VL284_02955 [Thermoanaerobaculia bacterium]|nr:hypothetical protein [Thermoanaerobaculia bacterium]